MRLVWTMETDPLQVVEQSISDFKDELVTAFYRYDQAGIGSGEQLSLHNANKTFTKLRRLYDQWRFFLRENLPNNKSYLEGMTKEDYDKVIANMLRPDSSGNINPDYHIYKRVRDKIRDFFIEIAFSSQPVLCS